MCASKESSSTYICTTILFGWYVFYLGKNINFSWETKGACSCPQIWGSYVLSPVDSSLMGLSIYFRTSLSYASQELTSLHKIPELRWMLSSEPSAGFPWWRARESSEEDPFWLIGSLLPFHLQNMQGNSNFFSIKQLASRWNKAGRCYSPD